jgi:hypothetical protein
MLNGIEPAWTMLEFSSLNALRQEPSGSNRTIRLEPDLADAEISRSAVTGNALILLERAAEVGRLKLKLLRIVRHRAASQSVERGQAQARLAQGVGLARRLTMTRFLVILGDGQHSFG